MLGKEGGGPSSSCFSMSPKCVAHRSSKNHWGLHELAVGWSLGFATQQYQQFCFLVRAAQGVPHKVIVALSMHCKKRAAAAVRLQPDLFLERLQPPTTAAHHSRPLATLHHSSLRQQRGCSSPPQQPATAAHRSRPLGTLHHSRPPQQPGCSRPPQPPTTAAHHSRPLATLHHSSPPQQPGYSRVLVVLGPVRLRKVAS